MKSRGYLRVDRAKRRRIAHSENRLTELLGSGSGKKTQSGVSGACKSDLEWRSKLSCRRGLEINSYVDGELDQTHATAVQQHLDECETCSRGYRYYVALRSSIRNSSLYHRTPLELKMRVKAMSQTDAEREAAKRPIGLPW